MTFSQSTSLNPLRWLHLSDMHLGAPGKDAWWSTSLQFKDEIVEKVKKFGTPDVIFITGDIVFSASQENYEKFNSFINDLDSWIGAKPPIICVPGNHDIQRPDLKKTRNFGFKVLRDYVKGDEDVKNIKKEFWEQKNASLLTPMFEPYEKFLSDIIIPRLQSHQGITANKSHFFPGDIRVDIALPGRVPLTVIGLNSTWIQCSGDDYHGKLAVEPGQLRALLESDNNDGIEVKTLQDSNSILLMHHPLGWLHQNSQDTFHAEIYTSDRFDVCLCGHMHEAKQFSATHGGITRRFFQAPSLFGLEHWGTSEETREIGYAWGQLDNNGRIRVWPYRLAKDGNRFIFDIEWNQAEENEGLEIRPAKPDANRNEDDFSIEDEVYSSPQSVNPYKFLKFYDISDGEFLYGRNKLTGDIAERVNQIFTSKESRCFIGLTGRSGCGKSSLLRAGILSQLTIENHPLSYCTIAFRPTDFHDQEGNPQNIVQRIVGKIVQDTDINLSGNSLSEIEQTSAIGRAKKSVDKIVEALRNSQVETQLRLIIGLDQFEEILDDLASSERRHNWKDLINFIEQALRLKFIGFIYTLETSRIEIVQYTDIKHLIAETHDVDGFAKEFLREIITTPFKKSGYPLNESEGEIVSRLIVNTNKLRNEIKGDEADSLLPLLALTLTRLFEIVKEKSPRQDIYNAKKTLKQTQNFIGLDVIEDKKILDIRNAIKVEAQKAWSGKIDELGYFLRPLLRISDIASDNLVLRKVPIHPYQSDRLQAENFINRRLLVQEGNRIRLVHEAVIRFWPAALEWLNNEKDRLKTEKHFRDEAHLWSKKKRKQVSGNVDDAADILAAYIRSWTMSNSQDMNQKDQQLRDFCLAVFAKSEEPKKIINTSKRGLCHIHLAAIYDQVILLEKFKELDPASIKYPRLDGQIPLFGATWGAAKAVHYLLGEGSSAIKKDKVGWRPLAAPIIMGNKEIFKCLIGRYRKTHLEDWPGGSTALHLFGAINLSQGQQENHLAMARYLVEKRNLNPNQGNNDGWLPLHQLANQGYTFLFDYFAKISNLNAVNNDKWTALHMAASHGYIDIINLLLENDEFSQESKNALTSIEGLAPGANALHIAILNKHPGVVKLLLEKGIDPNIKAESDRFKGRNSLHMAANLLVSSSFSGSDWEVKEKAREIVQVLLDHPTIDINARDIENQTPLSLAKNDAGVLKMLLSDQRLDPNSPVSVNGPTPALICAEISDWELTDQVLARSSQAAHSSKTDKGNTLLHLLIQNKAPRTLIKKALDSSPVLSVTNNKGLTPLMIAIINDDLELVRLMLTYGKGVKYPSDIEGSALLVAIGHSASLAIPEELIKSDDLIQQLISTNTWGWNVQHFACARASDSTLDWLVNQDGGGLNEVRDQWGRRPIDLAPLGFQKKWGFAKPNQAMPKSWDKDLKWKLLSKKRVRELIKNVSPINDKYEITSDTNAECAKLPFYDQRAIDIIRLSCKKHWPDALRLYFIIYSKENKLDFYQLNGTSPPIHEINSKNLLTLNDENVLDYLRFFCFFVRGDEGAFLIAEDVTQHDMPDCLLPENILKLKTHLRPAMFFGKNKGKYRASANVYYSSALFFTDFIVHDSGMVEMEHDLPILEDLPINEKIPIS